MVDVLYSPVVIVMVLAGVAVYFRLEFSSARLALLQ